MQNITRLIAITALAACTFALLTGCTATRYEALERRQDRVDARHNARADRRDLREEHADARFDRW